jgi:hypothetical protein
LRAFALLVFAAACSGGHHHSPAAHPDDARHLYVEISADGSHEDALRDGAQDGLSRLAFAKTIGDGGDVELQVEVAQLDVVGQTTQCKVKILVMRLPQHDLQGIADGAARAGGTGDQAAEDCIRKLGGSLVAGKVRGLLRRRLDDKR